MFLIILLDPMQFIDLYHVWLEMLALIITSTLAVLTFIFLVRQHKLQETNIRLAAFDKRYKIYNIIDSFFLDVVAKHDITKEKVILMQQNTKEMRYLFNNNELLGKIDGLVRQGFILSNLYKETHSLLVAEARVYASEEEKQLSWQLAKEERAKLQKQQDELFLWFHNEHIAIDKIFEKYLRIEQN